MDEVKNGDDDVPNNPDFAIICSFISKFGDKLDLNLNIEDLKSSICKKHELDDSLIDLHVKLLRKIRRYLVRDLWVGALIRFVSTYSYDQACELDQEGYINTSTSTKLEILRRLLEAQFDSDQKFKTAVNACEANELRVLPVGRDNKGNTYWHQADDECNFMIFQEQPMDFKSWTTICLNLNQLEGLIDDLDKKKDDQIKGEPMHEPYDPYPELYPDIFEAQLKNEDQTEIRPRIKLFIKTESTENHSEQAPKKQASKHLKVKFKLENVPKEKEEDVDELVREQLDILIGKVSEEINAETLSNRSHDTKPKIEEQSETKIKLEKIDEQVNSEIDQNHPKSSEDNQVEEQSSGAVQVQPENGTKTGRKNARKAKVREEVLPRRSSSRIQQIQQKKAIEQEVVEKTKKEKEKEKVVEANVDSVKSSRTNSKKHSKGDDGGKSKSRRKKKGKSKSRGGKKKSLSWDKDDSDLSSTSSLTDSEEEDELEDDALELDNFRMQDTANPDDEFACEEEDANGEPVIVKRARTARQSKNELSLLEANGSSVLDEDKPCGRCNKSNDPEWILLCDMCDDGFHTSCCVPPLMVIPDGDWFCPPCEHKMLLSKLKDIQTSARDLIEAKEQERIKRERLRQLNESKKEAKVIKGAEAEKLPDKRKRNLLSDLPEPSTWQELDEESDGHQEEDEEEDDGDDVNADDLDQSSDESELASSSSGSYKPRKRAAPSRKRQRAPKTRGRAAGRRNRNRYDESEDELLAEFRRKKRLKTYSKRRMLESDDDESAASGTVCEWSSRSTSEVSEESEEEERPKTRRARASVNYRFQEYDELLDSAIGAGEEPVNKEANKNRYEDDDEDEELEEEEEEDAEGTCNYGRGKDMATIEALAYQQENGLLGQELATAASTVAQEQAKGSVSIPSSVTTTAMPLQIDEQPRQLTTLEPKPKTTTTPAKGRKKGRRLNDLDVPSEGGDTTSDESFQASEATDEDDEDEEAVEDDMTEEDDEDDEVRYDDTESSVDELIEQFRPKKRRK